MITWEEIEAECDGYRAGFVSVYRKYEGQSTDKKDGQGRTVKVTVKSFARQIGIPESTFGDWVRKSRRTAAALPERTQGQRLRQTVKNPNVSIEDKVGALEDLTSDPKVLAAYRERRAPKVTKEQAKRAEAVVDAFTTPLVQAAGKLMVPMFIGRLDEVADFLAEQELTEPEFRKMDKAARRIADELEVQKFRLGLEVTT
jgi:hypothetical protein